MRINTTEPTDEQIDAAILAALAEAMLCRGRKYAAAYGAPTGVGSNAAWRCTTRASSMPGSSTGGLMSTCRWSRPRNRSRRPWSTNGAGRYAQSPYEGTAE